MVSSTKKLTPAQFKILQWIGNGCPDGIYTHDGYGHRISARLLADSGLATITGRGALWKATITTKGKELLNDSQQQPREESMSDEVQQFYQRLLNAGGKLTLRENISKDNIDRLVKTFNTAEDRPRGKKISVNYSRSSYQGPVTTAWIKIEDYFEDFVETPSIEVPETVSRYHPVARSFRNDKNWQYMSKDLVPRALKILHTFAISCENQGWGVIYLHSDEKNEYDNRKYKITDGQFLVQTPHTAVQLIVREIPETNAPEIPYNERYGYSGKRKPSWMTGRARKFIPTGRLELAVKGSGRFSGVRDTTRWSIEDKLPELIVQIAVEDMRVNEWTKARELEEQLRKERKEVARAAAIAAYREDKLLDILNTQAQQWELWERANKFLDDLELMIDSYPADVRNDLREWIHQSRTINESQNPHNNVPTYPNKLEPTFEELKPYLKDGYDWSYFDF